MNRTLGIAWACTLATLVTSCSASAAGVVARPAVLVPSPEAAVAPTVTTVGYRRYWGAPYYAYRPYYRAYPYRAYYRPYYRPYRAYYAPYWGYGYYAPGYGPYYW